LFIGRGHLILRDGNKTHTIRWKSRNY